MQARRDQALRHAVMDLALLPASDIDVILSALPEDQRAKVEAMLAGITIAPFGRHEGLSPWLAERVASGAGMTSHATHILAQCAAGLPGDGAAETSIRPPSLLDRLFDRRLSS